jgi:hypothetical protein
MKAATLLKQAAKCKLKDDARKLLDRLTEAFQVNKSKIGHLETANDDCYIEDDRGVVSVEFNRKISDDYIIMIRPEIRDGKMIVLVVTNRMLDGLGMQSKRWEVATVNGAELEDLIEVDEDRVVLDVAKRAAELAISHHQRLIEQVGVPQEIAAKTAQKCW